MQSLNGYLFRKVCSKCSKIFIERVRNLQTADKNVSTTDEISEKKKKHILPKLVLGKVLLNHFTRKLKLKATKDLAFSQLTSTIKRTCY